MNINDVIIKPLITEKSSNALTTNNVYYFQVAKTATKTDIKKAIETIFARSEAKVEKVNVINVRQKKASLGKFRGYKAGYKKAMVKLSAGSIPIYSQEDAPVENGKKKKAIKVINTDKIMSKGDDE